MSDQFDKYIRDGDAAIRSHPDFANLDYETAAIDQIASILHAVDAQAGRTPEQAHNDGIPAWDLLERGWSSYVGDFEDIEQAPDSDQG